MDRKSIKGEAEANSELWKRQREIADLHERFVDLRDEYLAQRDLIESLKKIIGIPKVGMTTAAMRKVQACNNMMLRIEDWKRNLTPIRGTYPVARVISEMDELLKDMQRKDSKHDPPPSVPDGIRKRIPARMVGSNVRLRDRDMDA